MASFRFLNDVELTRVEGKFIANSDLEEEILAALEDSNPQEVQVENSTYEVSSWEIGPWVTK